MGSIPGLSDCFLLSKKNKLPVHLLYFKQTTSGIHLCNMLPTTFRYETVYKHEDALRFTIDDNI